MLAAPSPAPIATLSDSLADAVGRVGRAVVAIHARRRIPSSGVHWRDGIIVAADHTVRRDDDISVTLDGGRTARATVAGRDPGTDLIVLRLDGERPPVAEMAPPEAIAVGRLVLALGRPGADVTASFGIISAVGGEWRTWQGGRIDRSVRLDLTVYDGFSGGPLIDAAGRVLGIATTGLTRGGPAVVPATTVDRVVNELLERGRIRRGFLGVALQPVRLPDALRRAAGSDASIGLLVIGVEPGGPAERAGLLLSDILLTIDGHTLRDPSDVLAHIGGDRVGARVTAGVLRGGDRREVSIEVGERTARAR